jgi:hypothetical protein
VTLSILETMRESALFARWFKDPATWICWTVFLSALFGLPIDPAGLEIFMQCTGRSLAPTSAFNEAWLIVGRRGGKSIILALIAVFLAVFKDWSGRLVPGERGTVLVIAADKKQARVIFRYITALIMETSLIAGLVDGEPTQERIDLTNGISIEISTANFRSVRGYTIVAALCDEIAYWMGDDSANPDTEILTAIRPAMTTMLPDAMLLCASSPYAERGALHDAFKKNYGRDESPVLVWKASTRTMNPSVPQSVIDEAFERDPAAAAAEYGAEFRTDVVSFVDAAKVAECVAVGRTELPPVPGIKFTAAIDPSGGSSDSMTLALAHAEGDRGVLDFVKEWPAPFSPQEVVRDIVQICRRYGVNSVIGDRYAGEWAREPFRNHGIEYQLADMTRSEAYLTMLPAINSGKIELLDDRRLISQLCSLERRTARSGKDSVDHPRGGHDDVINAAALALVAAALVPKNSAENWLTFYHWQLHGVPEHILRPDHINTDFDTIRAAGPQFGVSFNNEPVFTLVLPPDNQSSHIIVPSGVTKLVDLDARGRRVVDVGAADARLMLNAGTGDSARWCAVNPGIAASLSKQGDNWR